MYLWSRFRCVNQSFTELYTNPRERMADPPATTDSHGAIRAMIQTAIFGNPGHAAQTYLPGMDTARLPAAAGLAPPVPDALDSGPFAPTADGTTALYNGSVAATTTGFGTPDQHTTYDVVGAWNSVKNASLLMSDAGHVTFAGIVHVDAMVGLGAGQASTVELIGAKRGNIVTGGGEDQIAILVASNGPEWSNEFRVSSGSGKDVVSASLLDMPAAVPLDPTFAASVATSLDQGYDGSLTTLHVDLGAEDDAAKGLSGNDVIDGGAGSSFLTGGGGADSFILHGGGEVTWSTITDWQAGDRVELHGWQAGVSTASWLERAGASGWEGATMHADLNADGAIDASVTWTGLSLAQVPALTAAPADGMIWFA